MPNCVNCNNDFDHVSHCMKEGCDNKFCYRCHLFQMKWCIVCSYNYCCDINETNVTCTKCIIRIKREQQEKVQELLNDLDEE